MSLRQYLHDQSNEIIIAAAVGSLVVITMRATARSSRRTSLNSHPTSAWGFPHPSAVLHYFNMPPVRTQLWRGNVQYRYYYSSAGAGRDRLLTVCS